MNRYNFGSPFHNNKHVKNNFKHNSNLDNNFHFNYYNDFLRTSFCKKKFNLYYCYEVRMALYQ